MFQLSSDGQVAIASEILNPSHEECNPNIWKKNLIKSAILENESNYL
jgi:hypothetical protein